MSALNQNYASGIYGFASGQCYRAVSGGDFNRTHNGELAASAVFWIDGEIQRTGVAFETRQFIWGNLDDANEAGWGIYLEPNEDGQCVLTASLWAAAGILRTSGVVISNGELPGFVERLICAALWYDGASLTLSVNGSRMPVDASGLDDPYTPSALAASLGGDLAGAAPAVDVRVVSAAYTFFGDPGLNPRQAGQHFSACRESDGGGYLIPGAGVDWVHRYEAANAVLSGTAGTVVKTAAGARQSANPLAPTTLADVGNQGPSAAVDVAPAALTRLGEADLPIAQVAQPDWYAAAGFEFQAPVPA